MLRFSLNNVKDFLLFLFAFILIYVRAYEDLTLLVTRLLIPIFFILSLIINPSYYLKIPKIQLYLALLFVWSLITFVSASDFENYWRYNRLLLGILILMMSLGAISRAHNILFPILWGNLVGGVGFVIDGILSNSFSSIIYDSDNLERASGVAGNPNTLGAILLISFMSISILWLLGKANTILYLIVTLLFLYVIILTASRSNTLGIILVFILAYYYKFKNTNFLLFVVSIFVVLFFYELYDFILDKTLLGFRMNRESSGSDDMRQNLIYFGIDLIIQNPIFGVGAGNFTNSNQWNKYSHNDLIELTATMGIPALIIYATFIIKSFNHSRILLRNYFDKEAKIIGASFILFLIIFMVQGLFKPLFIDILYMYMYFVLLSSIDRYFIIKN